MGLCAGLPSLGKENATEEQKQEGKKCFLISDMLFMLF